MKPDPFAVADLIQLADQMIALLASPERTDHELMQIAEKWKLAARKVTMFILDSGKSSPVEKEGE